MAGTHALTTAEFVAHLRSLDIRLSIDDERLRCSAPKCALTAALRDELAARKAEIVAWLRVNGHGRGAGFAAWAADGYAAAIAVEGRPRRLVCHTWQELAP